MPANRLKQITMGREEMDQLVKTYSQIQKTSSEIREQKGWDSETAIPWSAVKDAMKGGKLKGLLKGLKKPGIADLVTDAMANMSIGRLSGGEAVAAAAEGGGGGDSKTTDEKVDALAKQMEQIQAALATLIAKP